MASIKEREFLAMTSERSMSGFTPRQSASLRDKYPDMDRLKADTRTVVRSAGYLPAGVSRAGRHPTAYLMWLEAGKHDDPYPSHQDPNYNSNVWRNFRRFYALPDVNSDDRTTSELVANMYPINVPAPSKLADNSYAKYLAETPIIADQRLRHLAIERTMRDVIDFKRTRLASDMRRPPMDVDGRILPPVNFKKYADHFIPPEADYMTSAAIEAGGETRVDVFGQKVPAPKRRENGSLWKLTYRLNNPQYAEVRRQAAKKNAAMPVHPPYFQTKKI